MINVITIKWGNKYLPEEVNMLYRAIKAQTSKTLTFHCFTDNPIGLDANIKAHSLPDIKILPQHKRYLYIKEAGLCDDQLGNLTGQRVFFFDLDVLICGNLDELFAYPSGSEFVIINDWNSKGNRVGQASLYSWVVGNLGFIKTNYEKNSEAIVAQFGTASQEYLSAMIIHQQGALTFWPEEWCVSFKKHCLPKWYLRYFIAPQQPQNAKMIAFHGDPKITNALEGKWSDKILPFYKRLYKYNLPAPWIKQYLY